MLTHGSRQPRSWLIFDVGQMKASILSLLCAAMLTGCWSSRRPCVYELPEGFTGWAFVEFEVRGAPPLPHRDGKLLVSFPPSGRIVTSSSIEQSFAKDEFYFIGKKRTPLPVSMGGSDGLIWGQVTGVTGARTFQRFFVGSRQEFAAHMKHSSVSK